MKKTKKFLSLMMVGVLALSCIILTSCGGPKNLEEYVNNDSEAKKQIESYSTDNMAVKINENDIIFEYKFEDMELTDDVRAVMKAELEKQMASQASTFENIAKQFEEETELTGIKVIVKYLEPDGTVLYENSYTAK